MPWQDASPFLMSLAWVRLSPPQSKTMIVLPRFLKIDTIAGAVVDAQLTNSFADRFSVACVPLSQPIQSRSDHRAGAVILEPLAPLPKSLRLLQLKHLVVYKLRTFNNQAAS